MKTIAIHGSSGWLGRSTFYYLNSFDLNIEKFILTSNSYKEIKVNQHTQNLIDNKEFEKLENENIDILYLFGFPMDKMQDEKILKYKFNKMIDELNFFLDKNVVKKIFLPSSGIVYFQNNKTYNLYSIYKKIQEEMMIEISERMRIELQICRVFSLISPLYDLSKDYALTSFIKSGLNKSEIYVKNGNAIRSYANFEDIVKFSLKSIDRTTYDASSSNIEIKSLAEIISQIFDVNLRIDYENDDRLNEYISSDNFFKEKNKDDITPIDKRLLMKIIDITRENNFELK